MESQSFWSKGYVHTLMTLVLVAGIAALSAYAYYTFKQSEGVYTGATTITVSGEGEIQVKPDLGMFSFSVRAEGKDASEAQTKSAEKINAIIAAMKEGGVEEKDIKTTNYNLAPKYKYEASVCTAYYCPPVNPKVDGYEVSQMVEVKVRDLSKSGDLISKAGEKGATDMSNLQFTVDDENASKAQAREKAIVDAKAKAEVLAKNLGMKITKMTSFYEQDNGGYYPMAERSYAMGADASFKGVSPEMPIGENTVKVTVNMTYELE
jgi:uncharacterized protein